MTTKTTTAPANKASDSGAKTETVKTSAETSAAKNQQTSHNNKNNGQEISGNEGSDVHKGNIQGSKTDVLIEKNGAILRKLDLSKLVKGGDDELVSVKLKFQDSKVAEKIKLLGKKDESFIIYDNDKISLAGSAEDIKALLADITVNADEGQQTFRIDVIINDGETSYNQSLFVRFDNGNSNSLRQFNYISLDDIAGNNRSFEDVLEYKFTSLDNPVYTDASRIYETFSSVRRDVDLNAVSINTPQKTPLQPTVQENNTPNIPVVNTPLSPSQPSASPPPPAPSNIAPVVNQALLDQAATEDLVFSYQFASNSFTDTDAGDTLTYSATLSDGSPLPAWLSFDDTTRTFSGTPAISDVGAITVRVTTSDGTATVTDDFTITTANANDAPTVANALLDRSATEDSAFSYQFASNSFTDADGDTLTYSATLSNGSVLPSWLSFDANTRTFSGTPANGDVGIITVRVTTSDGTATVTDDFTITTANTNDAPIVANALLDRSATEDSAFSYQFASNSFTDADGDTLTYSATLSNGSALPSWLSFDAATRTFSGTPANGDVGAITVRVTTSDGTATVTDDFNITTINVNDAPVLSEFSGTINYTEGGAPVTIDNSITITDVDSNNITTASISISSGFVTGDRIGINGNITAIPIVSGALTFANQAAGTLTFVFFNSTKAQVEAVLESLCFGTVSDNPGSGDRTISISVSDGTNTSNTQTVTIQMTPTNDAPIVANALLDRSATEDSAFSYQFASNSFTDADGDTLTYSATLSNGSALPIWLSFDANTRTFSGTPTNSDVGAITVRVTTSDGTATVTDDFTITTTNVNDAPQLDNIDNNSYQQNAAAVVIDSIIDIIDVDDTHIASAVVSITGNFNSGDLLNFTNQNGITGSYDTGTGILTLTGSATKANYETALESISFSSNSATIGDRTISYTINDGDVNSNTQTATINYTLAAQAVINLSSLNGTNGFRLDGVATQDYSGYSVSGAGDINGDGFDDIIVGAWRADPNGSNSGSSYVVFGKASGFSSSTNLSTLNGTNGFRLDGVTAEDFSGRSVSSAGDVNGDGFDDIIVGAHGSDPNGLSSGSSYVIFGSNSGFTSSLNLSSLNGTNGFRLDGVMAGNFTGTSVSNAGDMNGDGFDDIIVGAYRASFNPFYSGSSYVVFGKAGGFTGIINLSSLDGASGFRLDGIASHDFSGRSVSSAGDVNGDGFDDVIVGARGADANGSYSGSSYVVFGKASGFNSTINLSTLSGTNGFRLDGVVAGDRAFEVSSAGDVNGDGFDDLIVGAYGADPNGNESGSSYVVFGSNSGFASSINLSSLNGSNGFRLDGASAGARASEVSNAGDVNGDGFDDLIVGAMGAYTNGASYVFFGKASGFTSSINLSSLNVATGFRLDGVAGDVSAVSVSNAGDVNGDGFDDLIVGSIASPNGIGSGSSYVIFGNNDSGAASHVGTSGDDTLTGTGSADTMIGGLGDDEIDGGAGNDVIKGANGNDTIVGGAGADRIWGGSGNDVFVYTDHSDSGIGTGNRDIIYDFESTIDDIDLSAFAGTFSFIGTGAFSGTQNEVRFTATGTNVLVQVDSDANGLIDFEIQLLGAHSIGGGDFIL